MPPMDLCCADGSLDPFAVHRILAVMVEPSDATARRSLLAPLRSVVPGASDRDAERGFHQTVDRCAPPASVAAEVVLYLLQTNHEFGRTSLNAVIPIIRAAVPPWNQPTGSEWHSQRNHGRHNQDPAAIRRNFRTYRSVAHLWAAQLITESENWDDAKLDSAAGPMKFLAIADEVARLGAQIHLHTTDAYRRKEVVLPPGKIWTFVLPNGLREELQLVIPPLNPAARAAFRPTSR